MAKQALKEEFEFPSGGIADFYMEDHEIEALERAEAEEEFGSAGIATFQPIATRMASYGRYGDDTVAHVETGELVVPKALIDQNPKLKASIFNHLRELGVEDPERYVVGSRANSLNPETGLPEFFLKKVFRSVKKAASKIAKGVKKTVKKVAKVIKKAAPIVLPAVGTFFMGPIYGAALGSGIATLVQGGDLKAALKSAVISGGTGAILSGITGGFSAASKPGGSFTQGFSDSVKSAANTSNISTGLSNMGKAVKGDFSGMSLKNAAGGPTAEGGTNPIQAEAATATDVVNTAQLPADASVATNSYNLNPDVGGTAPLYPDVSGNVPSAGLYGPDPQALTSESMFTSGVPAETTSLAQTVTTPEPTGFVDTVKGYGQKGMDLLTGADPTDAEIYKLAGEKIAQAKQAGVPLGSDAAVKAATAELTPGLLRTYGPSLALAGGAAYASGMFDTPPQDEPQTAADLERQLGPTGPDLIAADPDKYLVAGGDETPQYSSGQYAVDTTFGYNPTAYYEQNPFLRARGLEGTPFVQAAAGGEIFPRRVGGIMPNEGVPGQDSVRAMLMPGEFVMTTNAVKGLGNGNNQAGINRMYDLMRGLEAKGKAMA
jgi:hypothetical protein